MKKKVIRILMLAVLLLGFSAEGMAISAYGDDLDRPPAREQREKMRERIKAMKMWRLTRDLDLDEKLAARLFPLLHEYEGRREEIEKEIRQNITSLKEVIGTHDEPGMKEIMKALEMKHDALQRLGDEERSRLRDILTIEQQAKYLIFTMEFKREIRKMISEAKWKRRERAVMDRHGGP